jgi:hypothetical protein
MLRTLAAISLFALPSLQSTVSKKFAPLKFAKDGTFQISVLEDLHFGESKSPTPTPRYLRLTFTKRCLGHMGPRARRELRGCYQPDSQR